MRKRIKNLNCGNIVCYVKEFLIFKSTLKLELNVDGQDSIDE